MKKKKFSTSALSNMLSQVRRELSNAERTSNLTYSVRGGMATRLVVTHESLVKAEKLLNDFYDKYLKEGYE